MAGVATRRLPPGTADYVGRMLFSGKPTSASLGIPWSGYAAHSPHPAQMRFLRSKQMEALYGGAAGGGKSDALLMAALQYADVPNYAALILRKTYSDLSLPGAIMDRSHQWLRDSDAHWSETDKTWTFPSGARLTFGYLQYSADRYRYQSAEFQYIAFDELTQFPEEDYRYLLSRLRRLAGTKIPLRMRSASNPGGRGHRWVKERFLDPPNPKALGREFVPAKLEDNPSLDRKEYESALSLLDPLTRAQLRHGDWSVRPAGRWVFDHAGIDAAVELGRELDAEREAGALAPPTESAMRSGCDYGDFATVVLPLWRLEGGGYYVPPVELHRSREDLVRIATDLRALMAGFPYWWAEHRYDASFAQSNRTVAALLGKELGEHNAIKRQGRPNTLPVNFGEYKTLSVQYLRLLLRRTVEGERVRCLAISPANSTLIDQMREYEEDEFGKFQKGDDDAVDALIAGVAPDAKKHRAVVAAALNGTGEEKLEVLPSQRA